MKKDSYEESISNGLELAGIFTHKSLSDKLPKDSVGLFLNARKHLKRVYDYYSRKDIQQAMYKYALGRKITFLRYFSPMFDRLMRPDDILPLAMHTLLEKGRYWPSLHGTVSRYGVTGGQLCDLVIEIDYKSNWKTCFAITHPIVNMLIERGAIFRLKFSGHCSVHIIIPAEMLTENGLSVDHSKFFRCLTDLIKGKLKEPRYLDTSFYMPEHFLRLAYSVNENTGLVSLPFDVKDYDKFDPVQAEPERVVPMQGWWSFPKLVPEQMREFIKYVIGGRSVITSSKVADVQLPGLKIKPEIDRKLIQQARQQKKMAAREFLPNEGYYDRMVRLGQDAIDLRELLLLNDNDIKVALRSVRHLSRTGQSVDIGLIARRFDVDEQDLRLLWDWERKNLRYYARDDISQAIHEIASRRKMRVGSEEKMYFLQEAVDILPLVVYSQLIRKDENTALYFTNSKYERTGEIPIACDIKIEFSTKSKTCVFEAAAPVVSLLAGFDVTFFMYFDGVEGLNIIIPYESLPAEGKLASLRHESILIRLAPLLKRSMRMEGATCTLVRDCNAFSIVPYSLHPKTGLACMPLRTSDLRSFYLKDASPAKVEVDNEWWHIPDDAAIAMSGFLNQMALL